MTQRHKQTNRQRHRQSETDGDTTERLRQKNEQRCRQDANKWLQFRMNAWLIYITKINTHSHLHVL